MLEKKDLDLEKAVLVGIITKDQEIDQSKEDHIAITSS